MISHNLEKQALKEAEHIKKLFNEGHDRVFVQMDDNRFFTRFESNHRSEYCYYIGNNNQTVQELQLDLMNKMISAINTKKSHAHYYNRRY